ncbi:MAG: polysaccharide deacetylase family protein [Turicibacter sp.]|nr:polysaccharide deacetylase family protein [Turicibacter sp.]
MNKTKWKVLNVLLGIGLLVSPQLVAKAKDVSWGIPRKGEGEVQPHPGAEYDAIIRENDAFYIGDPDDNAIYLTFDCGYENGNLPMILDALRDADVPALFFLTGHLMEEEPELVLRMVEEGHLVGNHTYDHPNLTTVSQERFFDELTRAEAKFYDITGVAMDKYLRPPEGRFNQEVLDWASDAGYYTVLWSLAYVDWHVGDQKGGAHAHEQVMRKMHPGAIILLHSTSSDNAEAMADLVVTLREEGYEFRSVTDLVVDEVMDDELRVVFD